MSEKFQYIILIIILVGVIVWIMLQLVRKKGNGGCNCGNCSLRDACNKTDKNKPMEADCASQSVKEDGTDPDQIGKNRKPLK